MRSTEPMKDAGLQWLSQIPARWPVVPTRLVLRLQKETVGAKSSEYLLLSLTKQGVIPRDIQNSDGKFPASFDTYQRVNPNDLIFCLFDMDETPRTVGLVEQKGMLTGAYTRFVVDQDRADPRYLTFYFISIDDTKAFRPLYTGLRKVIQKSRFLSARLPLPPLDEQRRIADFLDRETARIDKLIDAHERIAILSLEKCVPAIELVLREHREQYPRAMLGWYLDVLPGYAFSSESYRHSSSDAIRLLRGINVTPNGLRWDETVWWPCDRTREVENFSMRVGDLVLGLDRPWIKGGMRLTVVAPEDLPALLLQRVARMRAIDNRVLLEYAALWIRSAEFEAIVGSSATGVSVPHISTGQVSDFRIPIPPLNEQRELIERDARIREATLDLSRTVSAAVRLLREYRTALITEAVTGKIDPARIAGAATEERLEEAIA